MATNPALPLPVCAGLLIYAHTATKLGLCITPCPASDVVLSLAYPCFAGRRPYRYMKYAHTLLPGEFVYEKNNTAYAAAAVVFISDRCN